MACNAWKMQSCHIFPPTQHNIATRSSHSALKHRHLNHQNLLKQNILSRFSLKTTLEGFKEDIHSLRTGFPDFHLTVEDIIADRDKVWIRMRARGTNLGSFTGSPTGKSITITVMDVCRFENGKIVEHWGVPDRFALLVQLGLLPRSGR
jgi:predicted ester cyclase